MDLTTLAVVVSIANGTAGLALTVLVIRDRLRRRKGD